MERKLKIAQHVNLVDEAIMLLYLFINRDDLEELKLKYTEDYKGNLDFYNQKFDVILNIYKDVKDNLQTKKERIDYFFKSHGINFFFYSALAVLWDYHNPNNKLLTYEERFCSMTEEAKVKEYAEIINDEEAANTPTEKLMTFADLVTFLDATPCDKEVKWEVIKIYNNQETYYNEVISIIKETVELIQKHNKEVIELEQTFYEYWNEIQKKEDIIVTIHQKLHVTWQPNNAGTILIPHIFEPFCVSFSSEGTENSSLDVLRIGIMIDQRFVFLSKKIKAEDIVNIGKLLCDKSKIDILELISKKPYYGKEISKELNLTTATISYHVNALLKTGFIRAEVDTNKVYYSMDRERISAYLDDIKEYFTKL